MANSEEPEAETSINQVVSTNLTQLSKEECIDTVNDMSTELYHLSVSLKSPTKENIRIKENNVFLSERNASLESLKIEHEKIKIELSDVKCELAETVKREGILAKQLELEHELIKKWKTSRNVAEEIINVQGKESFCEESWRKEKKKLETKLVEKPSTDADSTDDDKAHPLKDSKTEHPLNKPKPVSKAKLVELNNQYGSLSKNFVK